MNPISKISKYLVMVFTLASLLCACELKPAVDSGSPRGTERGIWINLFDGQSLAAWSGVNGTAVGAQWQMIDDELVLSAGGGGDIISIEQFSNFELSLEWKITPQGNSGIFYRVVKDGEPVWRSGVEYQILDDSGCLDLCPSRHKAGGVFDMYAPKVNVPIRVNEFNHTRIIVNHGHVEHWLNGHKVVEYEWKSDDWYQRLSDSKFKNWNNFGKLEAGHIAFQDHGDVVAFRNIKIRKLSH